MQKTRLTPLVILLACGIGIGFTLRTIAHRNAPLDGALAEPSSQNQTQRSDALHKEKSKLTAGTIEEQFTAALKQINEQEQRQACRAIFARLGLDELTPLAAQVEKFTVKSEFPGSGCWFLCNEFYRRWGELAPAEALKFLKDHESYWAGPDISIWKGWARTDPDGAVAAYDPKLESSDSSTELKQAILEGLCSVDPAKALRFADAQKMGCRFTPENGDEMPARYSTSWDLLEYVSVERPCGTFEQPLYSWIYRNPEEALEAMLALHYGHESLQEAPLKALFSNWLMFDPDAALRSLKKITDRGLRESTTHTAMQAYLLRHPREAFAKIIELPKYVSYRYKDNPSEEISRFAEENSSTKREKIEMDEEDDDNPLPDRYCHTGRVGSHGRMDLISEAAVSLGITEGKAAWNTALAVDDKSKRAAALGGALAGWLIFDREEAVGFAAAGISNHSFEDPGGSDFPSFAARLVSKNLAQHDFKQAVAWVESLPAGPLREAGIHTAAQTRLEWAWNIAYKEANNGYEHYNKEVAQVVQNREYAPVIKWLASLPPSTGRDKATHSLVYRLEDHDDSSNALKWAATIDDPELRRKCFESLARKIFSKKNHSGAADFDFDAWSAGHPELTEELKLELARKKNDKGGINEK